MQGRGILQPEHFISTARTLVNSNRARPSQVSLRRATSTAYYAMFHTLAKCCADSLVGGQGARRSPEAWNQVYRALEHGHTKNACVRNEVISKFPGEIQDFANMFVQMQKKRHSADYDPNGKSFKSGVLTDIDAVEVSIQDFCQADVKDRRAFAAFVLFKLRNN